tara:strand:+ start:4440 stop:4904 length:465 start_codon:yes stop_codon:yes gene_type:complete
MARYAQNTQVSADRSRGELEKVLQRYGAEAFAYGTERTHAFVAFRVSGRSVRFSIQLPDIEDQEFTLTPTGRERAPAAIYAEWEKATRQRWRALLLVVKAKLEAIDSGISSFEQEFLAWIVDAQGRTLGDTLVPQLDRIASGSSPLKLLENKEP